MIDFEFDWRRALGFLGAAVIGLAASYYGQPLIHGNDQAINVVVTTFSILAGFLVAIIAVVGDVALMTPGTWRALERNRRTVNNRLIRHKWLFLIYLLTLLLVFAALVAKDQDPCVVVWLERAFLFLGTFAFLMSLRLPDALLRSQLDRIDVEIDFRRANSGQPEPGEGGGD